MTVTVDPRNPLGLRATAPLLDAWLSFRQRPHAALPDPRPQPLPDAAADVVLPHVPHPAVTRPGE